MLFNRSDFPQDFLFGTATSSYQIEGHATGGAGRTQWDDFAQTPGNVVYAEHGGLACDHFNRWQHDLDFISNLGLDIYRFSTSWARILPDGTGTINAAGLDFYDRLVDGMLARNLKPALTLYHWELPSPLLDLGGWRNRDIAHWFADYTTIVMERLGDRVWSTAPINEPWCVGWLSHFMGQHAPGVRDIRATARAMHHVLLAQGMSLQAMRGLGLQNLGAICNFEFAHPFDDTPESKLAAARYDAIYNRFFLGGLCHGAYPDLVLEGLEPHLPTGWQDDFETIQQPVDWIGLNYYTRKVIVPEPAEPWPSYSETTAGLPETQVGWEIYPEGLSHFLRMIHTEFAPEVDIYVTENGIAWDDIKVDGQVEDEERISYLSSHLSEVKTVLDEGIPVKGYVIWSLMDNYEWAHGYAPRFGLLHIDFDTMDRTPKASYKALQTALTAN